MMFQQNIRHLVILMIAIVNIAAFPAELIGGWESVEPGGNSLRVSISFTADGQYGWTSGIRSISRTANGGKSWVSQWNKGGNDAYWFNNIVAISDQEAVVTGFPYGTQQPGIVMRTTDGGSTWKPVKVGSVTTGMGYSSLVFTPDRKVGFLISNREGLFRTRDAGVTWEKVRQVAGCEPCWVATRCNISAPDNNTIFVGCSGAMACSTDGGETWSMLPFPESKGKMYSSVNFANPQRGWVFLHGEPKPWETSDGGKTWIASNVPGMTAFIDINTGWAINGLDIVSTKDGGKTWGDPVRVGGTQTRPVSIICTKTHIWVVGGQEGTGDAFLARKLLPGIKENAPAAGVIQIKFNMPQAGYATIQIINDKDEVVENVATGRQFPAGENIVWWDMSTLDDFWQPFTRSNQWQYDTPTTIDKIAAPGNYRWRGIWHPGLSLEYQYSFYPLKKYGQAWMTPDNTGGWLGDHSAPQDVIRTGNTMWAGAFCESGNSLLESDTDMKKLWGIGRIELACPRVLATDGAAIYFLEQGGWLGFANQSLAIISVNIKTKAARRILAVSSSDKSSDFKTGKDDGFQSGFVSADDKSVRFKSIEGLVIVGKTAWIADRELNTVIVCDIAPNLSKIDEKVHIIKKIMVEKPGRMRLCPDGKIACINKDGVVIIDPADYTVTPVVTGCTNPLGLAVDELGNFYIGEMDPIHQVKVFGKDGKLIRAIGKPGKQKVGPIDINNLESPAGIEVDAKGNVWVCEYTNELRRTSVWDKDGKCVNQVLGSALYGGGSAGIDPADANRLFANNIEMRRDPKTGEIKPINLIWRYDDPRYDRFVDLRAHNFGGPVPSYPFHRNGKLYFSLWGGYGMGEITCLWVYDKDQVRPVSACGAIPKWLRERMGDAAKDMNIFAWTDRNADGKVQPTEVQMSKLAAGASVWGVRMNDDFNIAFTTQSGKVGVAFFRAEKFTPEGYPIYTIPTEYVPVPNLIANDPNQTQACYTDSKGNAIGLAPFIFSLSPQGKLNWRYKLRWPGLHGGLGTTASGAEPGTLIAGIRVYGSGVVNKELGEVVSIGSNYGATDLLTCDDGLYIGRVFLDSRRGDAWSYNTPPTPAQLSQVSLGQEHFGGTFQRTIDEKDLAHFRYVVSPGGPSNTVIELKGLDKVKRFAGEKIVATAENRVQAELLRQQRAVAAKEEKSYEITCLKDVKIDGKPNEWPKQRIDGFALGYDEKNLYVYYSGDDDRAVFQNAAVEANFVEAFKLGDVVDVMLQTNGELKANRAGAGVGDIRLSFTMVAGKPTAILYDFVVPGTKADARLPFSSPWQTAYIDKVTMLKDAQVSVIRGPRSYSLEASIPLASIHLDPLKLNKTRGDVGLVISDQTGTRTVDRIYWSNKNTKIVSDLPSEARIQPNLWGTFIFGEEAVEEILD
jgi:photosystem II stability/assembly factor-like uncharacterized protein